MPEKSTEYEVKKEEFLREAAKAYDRMMEEDQEQMITFDQMEDRALEVGGKLERWLMQKSLSKAAERKAAEAPACCPRCHTPLQFAGTPKVRSLRGRTGPIDFSRSEGYCPSCRRAFFPSGPNLAVGR